MPDWLTDINNIGSISSLIGLVITICIFIEARKIRASFIRRIRLPEINQELTKESSQLSTNLKLWNSDKTPALKSFSNIKALLENTRSKLPSEERKKVQEYLLRLQPKKYFIFKVKISKTSKENAWELYAELSGLVIALQQLAKDSKWEQL